LVPKNQGKSSPPKPKRAYNVLNLSDKVKIWDLWKGDMPIVEVGWCYERNKASVSVFELKSVK
jgi:hypothetical protein